MFAVTLRRAASVVLAVALMGLLAGPSAVRAEDAAGGEKPVKKEREKKVREDQGSKDGLKGVYAAIAKEAGLSAEQQAVMVQRLDELTARMTEWKTAHGQKLTELKEKQAAAKAAGNKEEAEKLGAEVRALEESRKKIEEEGKAGVMSVLDPAQRAKMQGYYLYTGQLNRLSKLDLSEEQKGKVRALAEAAVAEMAKANINPDDKKAVGPIKDKLVKDVNEQVLNDDQRAKLPQGRQPRPMDDKPAKEKAEKAPKHNKEKAEPAENAEKDDADAGE